MKKRYDESYFLGELAQAGFSKVTIVESTTSTNDLGLSMINDGLSVRAMVIADSQSSGRGRLGRKWYSPPGANLYMSLILPHKVEMFNASLFMVIAGVAVCDGVKRISGHEVNLKWPNDIVMGGRKLGGILIETRTERNIVLAEVIGIGLNVNYKEEDLPPEIRGIATSLFMEGVSGVERGAIAAEIASSFAKQYSEVFEHGADGIDVVNETGRERLIDKWREYDITIGKLITVSSAGTEFNARAIGLDIKGRLEVEREDGSREFIHSGDVTIII